MSDWLRAQRLQRDRDRLQARVTELAEKLDAWEADGHVFVRLSDVRAALAADRTEEGEANEPA